MPFKKSVIDDSPIDRKSNSLLFITMECRFHFFANEKSESRKYNQLLRHGSNYLIIWTNNTLGNIMSKNDIILMLLKKFCEAYGCFRKSGLGYL